jgi:antibiotic biosynthesis monooxygenase (ABM) superfamily enzyme
MTVLYTVKSTISSEHEAAYNSWYNEIHIPEFFGFPGVVSARRFRAILGEDEYQYITLYELKDEPTLRRLLGSEHMKKLKADFDRRFPESRRTIAAYEQVWP